MWMGPAKDCEEKRGTPTDRPSPARLDVAMARKELLAGGCPPRVTQSELGGCPPFPPGWHVGEAQLGGLR